MAPEGMECLPEAMWFRDTLRGGYWADEGTAEASAMLVCARLFFLEGWGGVPHLACSGVTSSLVSEIIPCEFGSDGMLGIEPGSPGCVQKALLAVLLI